MTPLDLALADLLHEAEKYIAARNKARGYAIEACRAIHNMPATLCRDCEDHPDGCPTGLSEGCTALSLKIKAVRDAQRPVVEAS